MILLNVVRRNLKVFFKDKGFFISALISPMILLVLYATFLANVYKESYMSALPEGFTISESLINGTVVGQLISSLLAVCCVTIAFCSNLLMITDKASGTIGDFTVSPVKRSTIAAGYYLASAASTLIVTLSALTVGLLYLSTQGWYMSFTDVLFVIGDVILLTLFGTALSSCIHFFLSTNGQASAVGTIVSAGYGFFCGAYMPISSFGSGLQRFLTFLPGTYGTSLLKNHMMNGVFREMEASDYPAEVLKGIRDSIDCNLYFFDAKVPLWVMAAVLIGSVVGFTGLFVLFHVIAQRHLKKQ